jgi:hypothetical protein
MGSVFVDAPLHVNSRLTDDHSGVISAKPEEFDKTMPIGASHH